MKLHPVHFNCQYVSRSIFFNVIMHLISGKTKLLDELLMREL